MNAELPPFKNGEYNSESASTLDHDITSLATILTFIHQLRDLYVCTVVIWTHANNLLKVLTRKTIQPAVGDTLILISQKIASSSNL